MTETPAHSLETVWLIQATYAPDAAETRTPFRATHLARIAELQAAGVVVEAGAFTDVSSSMLLVRADSEQAALDIARQDVYMQNGVWVELRAKPFGRVRLWSRQAGGARRRLAIIRRWSADRRTRALGATRTRSDPRRSSVTRGRASRRRIATPLEPRSAAERESAAHTPRPRGPGASAISRAASCRRTASSGTTRSRAAFRARTSSSAGPARSPPRGRRPHAPSGRAASGVPLEARGVHDRGATAAQAGPEVAMQRGERRPGRALVRRIAGDPLAVGVRRQHLVRREQPGRQRGLA